MVAQKKRRKRLIKIALLLFCGMNLIAFFHAYQFTHFSSSNKAKTQNPGKLSSTQKLKTLLFGISNPRPHNDKEPGNDYQTLTLQSNKKIACWYKHKKTGPHKGAIIICHGYSSMKSSMLDKANIFDSLGYDTFLIDFMGSGGSEGNQTTLGYKEAAQVQTAYAYLKAQGQQKIYFFGSSMGAVAIMKAINDYDLSCEGAILECPFGSMYQTVSARFRTMHVPAFPMAGLLVFWGGIQNGFWAFGHQPVQYALKVKCPTLLLYGEQDNTISYSETKAIYQQLKGPKSFKTYPLAGHENYLLQYKNEWTQDISDFLREY